MNKKLIGILIVLIIIFNSLTTLAATLSEKYYTKLKIGLVTMSSSNLNIKLNGAYFVNGNIVQSGTNIMLSVINGKMYYNNSEVQFLDLKPINPENTLTINSSGKSYNYLGEFKFSLDGDKIIPINIIYIEDYLKGVVGYEMSNSYPIEALKSQAVAARNYALSNLEKHKNKSYDLCDDVCCQVYRGFDPSLKNVIKAVEDTKSVVLLYNSNIVSAYYSASNGGYTEASQNVWVQAIPYLVDQEDKFDKDYNWTSQFTSLKIDEILKSKNILTKDDKFLKIDINSIKKYESGRIQELNIVYKDKDGIQRIKTFKKESARTFLNLRSSLYDITYDEKDDVYIFKGLGYGHGVGMSQIGARNRALNGHTYEQILTFYYKGTFLKTLLAKVKNIILNKNEVLIGQNLILTSQAENGTGEYLYKYVIEKDGRTVYIRDFLADRQAIFTPLLEGNYVATVYIKDIKSSNSYDDKVSLSFKAFSSPKIKSISVGPEKLYVRKDIYIKTDILGGTSKDKVIGFEVFKGDRIVASKVSNSSAFSFIPYDEGEYIVRVRVKDNVSENDYDDIRELKFTVEKEPIVSRGGVAPVQQNIRLNITRNLRLRMIGTDVKLLQQALEKLGYFKYHTTTTYFGAITDKAVRDFQRDNGLKVDGIVGPITRNAIEIKLNNRNVISNIQVKNGAILLSYGMRGDEVKRLQSKLKQLGYFKYPSITGYFGSITESALKAFQKAKGLPQTGVLDSQTYKLLYN